MNTVRVPHLKTPRRPPHLRTSHAHVGRSHSPHPHLGFVVAVPIDEVGGVHHHPHPAPSVGQHKGLGVVGCQTAAAARAVHGKHRTTTAAAVAAAARRQQPCCHCLRPEGDQGGGSPASREPAAAARQQRGGVDSIRRSQTGRMTAVVLPCPGLRSKTCNTCPNACRARCWMSVCLCCGVILQLHLSVPPVKAVPSLNHKQLAYLVALLAVSQVLPSSALYSLQPQTSQQ